MTELTEDLLAGSSIETEDLLAGSSIETEDLPAGDTVDVIVIGGGAVGENAADYAVRGGLSTVLVESELLGGECSYWACMPSKALLRTPQAVAAARRLPGVRAEFDPSAVLARRDSFTSHWSDDGQVQWARDAGITVVRGRARLAGERTVRVGDRLLRARHAVVICTGSTPKQPPITGLDEVRTWTTRDATSTTTVPGRLAVLGGGPVGVELGQVFARLGSTVTLLETGPRVLSRFEPMVGERVAEALRADGVDVQVNTELAEVRSSAGDAGAIELRYRDGRTAVVDELLVATGRRPATSDIGLESVALDPAEELEPGAALRVDDSGLVCAVAGRWLYAAGDVTGRAPLTHQGKYAARIVGAAIAARARGQEVRPDPWSEYAASADHVAVPQVVFTDPEVAAVGRTERQATEAGLDVRCVEIELAVAGAALQADGYSGAGRIVVDQRRGVLVGVTFVGQDVAELLHAATVAIVGEVPLERLWHAVPAYPTISEVWLRLLEAYRASRSG